MGATLSNLTEGGGANGTGNGPGLGDIPESCVACVFMYLTPPEICNLARLNRAFRGAASSNAVWDSKLPSNYQDLLDVLPPDRHLNLSKKGIFALLSRPIPFDNGTKEVWVDRVTSGVCMSISAKAMLITGIEDRRYWSWIQTEESRHQFDGCNGGMFFAVLLYPMRFLCGAYDMRFPVVAYLQQIWWFEVDGSLKFRFPAGVYTLSFRLHLGRFSKRLGRRICNFDNTHGWDIKPVRFELSTSDGQQASCECCLDEPEQDDANGNHKRGSWIEYQVGTFIVSDPDAFMEIRFSMKQIDCTHSKGGLCLDSVSIMPSDLRDRRKRYCK